MAVRAIGLVAPGRRSPRPAAPLTFVTTGGFLDRFSLEGLADLADIALPDITPAGPPGTPLPPCRRVSIPRCIPNRTTSGMRISSFGEAPEPIKQPSVRSLSAQVAFRRPLPCPARRSISLARLSARGDRACRHAAAHLWRIPTVAVAGMPIAIGDGRTELNPGVARRHSQCVRRIGVGGRVAAGLPLVFPNR